MSVRGKATAGAEAHESVVSPDKTLKWLVKHGATARAADGASHQYDGAEGKQPIVDDGKPMRVI